MYERPETEEDAYYRGNLWEQEHGILVENIPLHINKCSLLCDLTFRVMKEAKVTLKRMHHTLQQNTYVIC